MATKRRTTTREDVRRRVYEIVQREQGTKCAEAMDRKYLEMERVRALPEDERLAYYKRICGLEETR